MYATKLIVLALSGTILLSGAIGLVSPLSLLGMGRSLQSTEALYAVAFLRVVFGALLFRVAPASRLPKTVRSLGAFIFAAGVVTPIVASSVRRPCSPGGQARGQSSCGPGHVSLSRSVASSSMLCPRNGYQHSSSPDRKRSWNVKRPKENRTVADVTWLLFVVASLLLIVTPGQDMIPVGPHQAHQLIVSGSAPKPPWRLFFDGALSSVPCGWAPRKLRLAITPGCAS